MRVALICGTIHSRPLEDDETPPAYLDVAIAYAAVAHRIGRIPHSIPCSSKTAFCVLPHSLEASLQLEIHLLNLHTCSLEK